MTLSLFNAPAREPSTQVGFSGNPIDRRSEQRSDDSTARALEDPAARLMLIKAGKVYLKEARGDLDPWYRPFAAASLGAGRWAMLTEVLLPGALPNIVTGIRTGLGFAWRGLIAAEMIATSVGLGYMLFVARDFYKTEVIVLGMIVIGVLWLLLDRLLLAPIERATSERWGMVQRA